MNIDLASVDAALTTTRAVRLRLDLAREVPPDVVTDCIDIAEQAPTGGNQGSRRWVVVRDPATKAAIAELYLDAAGRWMIEAHQRIAGTGHPNERVMASAAHLAEHLAEVPVLVIPTVLGRHDGSGRPGLFDSVIQAVWSFCVALRARGLGTAWTTAVLSREADLMELLGIPGEVTPIALLPVAYTIGTEFKPAPRYPAREITYYDRFSRTLDAPHGAVPRLVDGPGVTVEVDVKAPPERVWGYVADIEVPARFSEELVSARWDDGAVEPAVGLTFTGRNRHRAIGEWEITCHVTEWRPNEAFAWVTVDPSWPGAQWRFDLESIAGATRLRFHVTLGPGDSGITQAIAAQPDKEARIITRRQDEHRANMTATVEGIKALAESVRGGQ